jgi:hypothetical protein
MAIPVARQYTTTLKAAVPKHVLCEHCRTEYVYMMSRTAAGSGTSPLFLDADGAIARGEAKAEKALAKKLARDVDAVPCPKCVRYQCSMFPRARQAWQRWLRATGMILLAVVIVGALVNAAMTKHDQSPVPWIVIGLAAAVSVAMIVGRIIASQWFDPNSDPQTPARQTVASMRAVLKSDFDKLAAKGAALKDRAGPYRSTVNTGPQKTLSSRNLRG